MVPRSQNPYPQYMLFMSMIMSTIYEYDYDNVNICGEISWLISTKLDAYPIIYVLVL